MSALRPWLPFLGMVAQVAIFGLGCVVADHSGISTPPGEWPYLVGFALMTIFWASWPLGITLLTGIVGALATRDPDTRRGATTVGSWVAAAAGGLGCLLGLVWLAQADHASEWVAGGSLVLGGAVTLLGVRQALRAPVQHA